MSSTSSRMPLLDEHRSLLTSIVSCRVINVKSVENTIRAVGHYLSVHADQIPWFRMYLLCPPWQRRSRLLNQELDKDIVLRSGRPIVFYTLINPHSRKDLRVGTWHSRGKVTCNRFVMNKLYYTGDPNRTKEDGITLIEFVLRMDQQVAICVLHRRDYRCLIEDLSQGTNLRILRGNQANQLDVHQELAPVNLALAAAGFMNGPQVSDANIESGPYGPTLENYATNQHNSAFPSNIVTYNMTPGNIEATNVSYHHSPQICNPSNTLLNDGSTSAGHDLALSSYRTNPSNRWPKNDGMHDMPLSVRYHPDSASYVMNPSNAWPNWLHDMPMANDKGPVLPTNLPLGTHLVRKEQNNDGYGYSQILDYSERSLTIEARDKGPMLPTNLPPSAHLVTMEQNNDEYGYSPFLDYSEHSLTIEAILTDGNAHTDQMSWHSDSSFTLSVHSMDALMPNQNAMARDKEPMLPTNLPPGTHLVTKEQNNNEDGYSPFLNYSDCSLTIEARDKGPVLLTNFLHGAHLVTNEHNNDEDGYSQFLDFSGTQLNH